MSPFVLPDVRHTVPPPARKAVSHSLSSSTACLCVTHTRKRSQDVLHVHCYCYHYLLLSKLQSTSLHMFTLNFSVLFFCSLDLQYAIRNTGDDKNMILFLWK